MTGRDVFGTIVALTLAGAAFAPTQASAQSCTFSITDINFGAVAGTQVDTSGTLTANCTGDLFATIKVCPHFGEGSGGSSSGNPRLLTNGAGSVNYQLYSNSSRTIVWGSNFWPYAPNPPTILVTVAFGSGSASRAIYARYLTGQGAAAHGTYTSVFGGGNVGIRYKYNDGLSCDSDTGGIVATPQPSFTVRADRAIACTVGAQEVDFGTVANLTSTVDGTGSLAVNCTRNTPYAVSLGNGLNGTGPTDRKMSKGGAERVTYALYRDSARALPWGTAAGQTLGGTGTGAVQTLAVYGRVPAQTTPSTGTYTDTVVVTVTY